MSAVHAEKGDNLVVESPSVDRPKRDGEIVGLHHADGTPPYDVRWSGEQHSTLVFPGPDAHVRHPGPEAGTRAERGGRSR